MKCWPTGLLIVPFLAIMASPLTGTAYEATTVSDGGTIVGEVTYAGDPPPPEKLPVSKDTNVCGAEPKVSPVLTIGANKGIKDVLVSLPGITKGKALEKPAQPPVLDQKTCEYHPYAQIIPVGSTLKIVNSDDVLHNVKTKGGSKTTFNMAQPKFKRELSMEFKNPEIASPVSEFSSFQFPPESRENCKGSFGDSPLRAEARCNQSNCAGGAPFPETVRLSAMNVIVQRASRVCALTRGKGVLINCRAELPSPRWAKTSSPARSELPLFHTACPV